MSTATMTTDEPLVAQPDSTVLFMCRRSELRLVKTPRYPQFGPAGQKVGEHPGETIPFREGIFRCPPSGTVELEDGRKADSREVLEWLENHRLFGSVEEGFWRVDPTAPPISAEELQRLMEAATSFDEGTLTELLEQERAGWNRPDIVDVAERTLVRVREIREQARAEAQAQVAAEQKAATPSKSAAKKGSGQ